MKNMRHRVTVMRPTGAQEEHGALEGQPQTLIADVPCSITFLTGREAEVARQLVPSATHRVEMYGDPAKPLQYADWLKMGSKRFEVASINDKKLNGIELELLCVEVING